MFALYENGQILFKKDVYNERTRCFEIILNKEEIDQFINALPFKEIYNIMEQDINANRGLTDQPTTILELNIRAYRKIRVNGNIIKQETRKHMPDNFLKIYDFLINYSNEKSYEWYPDSICIYFYKTESVKEYKEWPKELLKIDLNNIKDGNICLLLRNKYVKKFLDIYKNNSQFSNIKYENIILRMFYDIKYPNVDYSNSICDDKLKNYY
jgi:hypothetical protein